MQQRIHFVKLLWSRILLYRPEDKRQLCSSTELAFHNVAFYFSVCKLDADCDRVFTPNAEQHRGSFELFGLIPRKTQPEYPGREKDDWLRWWNCTLMKHQEREGRRKLKYLQLLWFQSLRCCVCVCVSTNPFRRSTAQGLSPAPPSYLRLTSEQGNHPLVLPGLSPWVPF